MALSDFVNVSISIADATPKAIEFNTPLIMAKAPYLGARLYNCTPSGLAAMVTDGFSTASRAYQLVSTMASQSGGAAKAYVYARTTQQTQILDLTPTITTVGYVYSFNVTYNGVTTPITFTVAVATVASICTGLHALIDPLAGFTSVDGVTKVTLTSTTSGQFIQIEGTPLGLKIEDVSTDGSLAAQLAAAQADLGEAFYGLIIDGFSETEGNAAAVFTEANRKLCLLVSPDGEILDSADTDDLASDLKLASYHRTAVFMTRQMQANEHAALLARQLGREAGSSNWQKRQLAGVAASTFTATEIANAATKRAILYSGDRGLSFTRSGRAASGRPFDLTHGIDKMQADIETAILLTLVNNEKVPYAASGLAMIKASIDGVLANNETSGFIQPGWFVTMPTLADISAANKALRVLPSITFHAVAGGAIDSVTVAGTITL
jgi:hypothetical protein